MLKKVLIVIIAVLLAGSVAFTVAGVAITNRNQPEFTDGGYILGGDDGAQLTFNAGEKYRASGEKVSFTDLSGKRVKVPETSFLHMNNGGVSALSDGVLLDFNDLSNNFVNNYYISSGLNITPSGDGYVAESATGNVTFGDNIWKLSPSSYIIQSPELKITAGDGTKTETEGYAEVSTNEDGFVTIRTAEDSWMTLSEGFCIETASGVKVYPVSQLIDSGKFKMSIAKINVDPEDGIVLSEDETRRQIVPDIDITGIDGEDGTDGNAGSNGVSGANGSTGANGQDGVGGGNGGDGLKGEDGGKGGKGVTGRSASVSSSTNSALPSMTVGYWDQTATDLRGCINVYSYDSILTDDVDHPAKVIIYNTKTGETIECLATNASYSVSGATSDFTDLYEGNDEDSMCYYFRAPDRCLDPEGSYRLSVTAYYTNNDTIFQREFISRSFNSDSTGVTLSPVSAGVNSLDISVNIQEDFRDPITRVTVYLLTPEQNRNFVGENYTQRVELDYTKNTTIRTFVFEGTSVQGPNEGAPSREKQEIHFSALNKAGDALIPSDTPYVARVRVEVGSAEVNYNHITEQELNLLTLKKPISFTDVPTAYYDRVTGAFKVYRPLINDINGGIQDYTYIVYKNGIEELTRTVPASAADPVSFNLPTGVSNNYTFRIKANFFDNEKNTVYDLGKSNQVTAEGDGMPRLTYQRTDIGYFNMVKGTITMDLTGQNTAMKVDPMHPVTLTVYADQLYNQTIQIKNAGGELVPDENRNDKLYQAVLNFADNNNYAMIKLALYNLYRNTNYTITVSAFVSLGDLGSATDQYVERVIGTVSDRTEDTQPLAVSFVALTDGSTGSQIAERMTMSTREQGTLAADYTIEQLSTFGSCTLELRSGTGMNTQTVSSETLGPTEMKDLCDPTKGLIVTENFFSATLKDGQEYTILLSNVCDGTADSEVQTLIGRKYKNVFNDIRGNSKAVRAKESPPPLLTEPTGGVIVTPITNDEASKNYGIAYDNSLRKETIVGFRAEAQFSNIKRLGRTITYYVMEYTDYYQALNSNTDPIRGNASNPNGANKLLTATLDIQNDSNTPPAIAVFFGGEPSYDEKGNILPEQKYSDLAVYHAGKPNLSSGALLSGMDRGYRYCFAYTAMYVPDTQDEAHREEYPYSPSTEYESFKTAYGAGKQYGVTLGKGVAYVLNSGLVEAPREDPEFHTYLYSISRSGSNGIATIKYKYRFREKSTRDLYFEYPDGNLDHVALDEVNKWNEVDVSFTNKGQNDALIEPVITTDRYLLPYTCVRDLKNQSPYPEVREENDAFYLCHVPIEYDWGSNINGTVLVSQEQHLNENYIKFVLNKNANDDRTINYLKNRIYALKLSFWELTDPTNVVPDIFLPVTIDSATQTPYATLDTSRIIQLLGKDYQFHATVLYDNGDSGWDIVDEAKAATPGTVASMFAIQYTSRSTDGESEYGFFDYMASTANGVSASLKPSGAVAQMTDGTYIDTAKLESTCTPIGSPHKEDLYLTFKTQDRTLHRYLYSTHNGVDMNESTNVSSLSGRYVTPKGCSEFVPDDQGQNTGKLDSIVPAIMLNSYTRTTQSVTINEPTDTNPSGGITVTGKTQALPEADATYKVYMSLYTDRTAAEALASSAVNQGNPAILTLTDGEPAHNTAKASVLGLEPNTEYFMAFWMYMSDQQGGRVPTLLLNAQNSTKAVFSFKTWDKLEITSSLKMRYTNESYFSKYYEMDFSCTESVGFFVRYDILDADEEVVLSHEELTAPGSGILTVNDLAKSNHMTLDLTPSPARKKLLPGQNYSMRIRVFSEGSQPTDENIAGASSFPFTIPADNAYGAMIYAKDAAAKSLTYQVTMRDSQYSYMARQGQGGVSPTVVVDGKKVSEGALYAVRFGYRNSSMEEVRLHTVYDSMIFTANIPKYSFILDETKLTAEGTDRYKEEISEQTNYIMYVYAVLDANHNGIADENGEENLEETQKKTWEDFFLRADGTDATKMENCGAAFQALIDSFWNEDDCKRSGVSDTGFLVAMKEKSTTDSQGVLVNIEAARLRRDGTKLKLELPESAGIVKELSSGQLAQTFQRVHWSVDGTSNFAPDRPVYAYGDLVAQGATIPFEVSTDPAGYDIYICRIPCDLDRGTYTVTLDLYYVNSTDATVTYDFRISKIIAE